MHTRFLTVLRHARAKPSGAAPAFGKEPQARRRLTAEEADIDRPLAKSGFKQLERVCQLLATVKEKPDWIVASPALRTRQTAERVAELIGYTRNIGWNDRIYDAAAHDLLNVLQETHDSARHVLLVGHNPGVAHLVSGLCAGTDYIELPPRASISSAAIRRINLRFPTAGLAHFELETARWRQLHWGGCELRFLVAPRFLKR